MQQRQYKVDSYLLVIIQYRFRYISQVDGQQTANNLKKQEISFTIND